MAQALPLLVALIAGVAMAVQSATNGFLGRTAGSGLLASLISFGVGLLALVAATLILRPRAHPGWIAAAPWWAWLGGLYGAVIVFAAAWATPRLGAGTALVLTVAAQVAVGVLLDHFGALGLRIHPVSGLRAAGVLLVMAGALMVQRG
jgi:bacterial/archaeal transporter family-2 protein